MKKVLSILLVVIMLFTMVPASVFAAEGTTVKLVSFMRGDVTDLRSSELLEVQVEGYDGNPRELTYKWTSSLGTYLYIYNSHNMYGINNTYGEYEIYNTKKSVNRSSNVEADRSGDKTLSLEGFMWAAVYGAYTYNGGSASSALKGEVKVEVFDKNGNSLGSDSFSSFKAHNLDGDLDNVVIGLFEGDRKNVLDLLGESGIVHITCSASSVSSADILEGDEHIAIETDEKDKNTYNYFIKGVKAGDNSTNGDAQLEINIKKSSCKFHYNTSGNAEPIVYVFKKPKTATTTTTLTLVDDIDSRCEYFINGNKGEKQPDGTIVFTGLTPNTDYTVEVRAEYKDGNETKYVYSYVDDTTKPVYSAKIYTYLDGALTDFENIYGNGAELLVHENNDYSDYISLNKNSKGIYEAPLYNGIFYAWYKIDDTYNKASDYELVIEHANAELHLHNYTVNYDTNGGAFQAGEEVGTEIYASAEAVNATSNIPVREGYIFTGWDYSGKTIASGNQVTASISSPITLKAKWEKAINVTINVTIDHNSKVDTGFDQVDSKAEVFVKLLEKKAGSPGFVELGDKLHFTKDGVTDINGNEKSYDYSIENNVSTYTATADTYTGLLGTSSFGVAVSKTDYDVIEVKNTVDKNGDCIIDILLKYNPSNFDLKFSLEMDEDVPVEAYPDAAIVKVAFWNGSAWEIITQQAGADRPGTRVNIDPVTGEGTGSYPVWKFADDDEPYGNRIVVTGFIYGDSVITAPVESIDGLIATYSDGYYTATMTDVTDGKKYGEQLYGAYYDKDTDGQKGTLHGVISVEKYNVTFDAQGGTVNGKATDVVTEQYYIPEFDDYKPTMEDHNFLGWYTEDGEKATEGEILTEDITLYAKWDRILTGNVRVAGSYMQDGKLVNVWAVDRADSAVIVLLEITADGTYVVDSQTVEIVWPMADMIYGISEEYKFTGLDPEKTYRTEVLVLNYDTTYQNSVTAVTDDGDYANDYNADDFTAVYPESSKLETFVNAYLTFEPASYFQPVEVDATLIGNNLRPDDTLVEIWYKATGTDNAYQVISQHTVVPYGIEIAMGADGMDDGDYGYTVWNSVYDGNLYDYQAYLSKIDNKAVSEWPVSVVYGSPSRYSPLNNAPTGVLQVKLVPNRYSIVYNEMYEDASVVSYGTHIWSYETAIDYVPAREGYVFDGWYINPECTGEKVTAIAETVAQDTELYAKWTKRTDLELKVNYVDKDTNETLSAETKTAQIFGEVITAESLKKDIKGYSYDSATAESVTIGTGTNEITLYYVRNTYSYTVNYLEKGTDKVLATAKNASAAFGSTVKETAVEIDLYTVSGDDTAAIVIDTENNIINFYYTLNSYKYTVNYIDKETDKIIAKSKEAEAVYGSTVTEAPIDIKNYAPISKDSKSITITEGRNFINFYYAADRTGGGNDGKTSDGIPDMYQKKVIFKVVNGVWADGNSGDKFVYLTLMKNGEYAVDGTATLVAPTGMKANEGYEGGAWDVTPPATVSGTNTETYTYTFTKVVVPPADPENPDTPDVPGGEGEGEGEGSGSVDGGSHNILFGKTNGIGWYYVSKDGGQTWDTVFGNSTYEVEHGAEIIVKVGDLSSNSFTFYVNGEKYHPDENGQLVITVNGYMLIGAIGIDPDVDFEVPDVEESLNWFQKLIKAIKDFFAKLFGKN